MNNGKFLRSAALLTLLGFRSAAAVLTAVPMQGGMVMPMVSYHAAEERFHVTMPPEAPQLTPLLRSHPADAFDPADPWFPALDPSAQGASFSRRYGFVMDALTDPLPPGTQMWIRKLSGAPELKVFRYSGSEPKAWQPIFGTDGVTNALHWNGMMFHPAFTAPPGTNPLTAIFEIYLLDTTSGLEVPNASSGPLAFHWTNVSDGRPALRISPGNLVTWPANTTTNWVLESAASPGAGDWRIITNQPVLAEGQLGVTLENPGRQQYFRMRHVP